jgi:hypothetical protein
VSFLNPGNIKNTAVLDASKEVGLEINAEDLVYVISHHQTEGGNHDTVVANKSSENVAKFRCLGMTVTNKDCIHKEVQSNFNMQNASYRLV